MLGSIAQPAPSDAAPGGTSAIVSQLKKLNQKATTTNAELAEINDAVSGFDGVPGIYDGVHELCRSNPDTFALSCWS